MTYANGDAQEFTECRSISQWYCGRNFRIAPPQGLRYEVLTDDHPNPPQTGG